MIKSKTQLYLAVFIGVLMLCVSILFISLSKEKIMKSGEVYLGSTDRILKKDFPAVSFLLTREEEGTESIWFESSFGISLDTLEERMRISQQDSDSRDMDTPDLIWRAAVSGFPAVVRKSPFKNLNRYDLTVSFSDELIHITIATDDINGFLSKITIHK